jgi:hypothetical protein
MGPHKKKLTKNMVIKKFPLHFAKQHPTRSIMTAATVTI